VALKKASRVAPGSELAERIRLGEKMILERRCSEGGWNYVNRKVLGTELPSYPETTALALLGLAGNPALKLSGPLQVAQHYFGQTRSPLAKAWLRVSLRSHSIHLPSADAESLEANDTVIQALEVIAASGALA
jgi:hypothetical protein